MSDSILQSEKSKVSFDSHLLAAYALATGSKISKPWLNPQYYALPFERYICLHPSSSNPARCYDHWQEVVRYLLPFTEAKGLKIVQVGGTNDILLDGAFDARGTTKREMQHIVQHCEALVCVDSCNMHFASAMGKKIVALHAVLYPQNSGPLWSEPEDVILLEAPRMGNKPTFSLQEGPKTINFIKPEEVANAALESLGFEERINEETLFIGRLFEQDAIEIIPDKPFDSRFTGMGLNFRLDLLHDLVHLPMWAHHCKVNIMTKQPLPADFLRAFKPNILAVQCDTSGAFDVESIKAMRKTGVPINFYFKGSKEELNQKQFEYFDENIHWLNKDKPEFASLNNLKFYSNRRFFDKDGCYLTEARFFDRIPSVTNYDPLTSVRDLECADYLRIVKTK